VSWALIPGCKGLLQWAGQMPHTVYQGFGFREVKRVHDPRLARCVAGFDTEEAREDLAILRVMLLTQDKNRS